MKTGRDPPSVVRSIFTVALVELKEPIASQKLGGCEGSEHVLRPAVVVFHARWHFL